MIGSLKILRKDLFELLEGYRGILLAFVLPSLLLLLVGQLRTGSPPFRMLVAGEPSKDQEEAYEELLDLLGEVSVFEISTRQETVLDPLHVLHREGFDLVLSIEGESTDDWPVYTAETHRGRQASLRRLVAGLDRALRLIEYRLDEEEGNEEIEELVQEFTVLGTLDAGRLKSYYPRVPDRALDLVGGTLALILCVLPFVLTAPSLIREKQAHTLEILLSAPSVGPHTLIAGKCLFAVVVTLFNFFLMIVLAQSVYLLQVKSGLIRMVAFLSPALVASAFLGLAVSAVAKSQWQTMIASAIFFFGMTLLSGFLYPIEEASALIQALSKIFSLTFVRPVLRAWTMGVQPVSLWSEASAVLWIQCAAYGLLAVLAMRRALRRI